MLDPLTALSVASSILQLVDFGGRLLGLTLEAVRSTHGTVEENVDISVLAGDLEELSNKPSYDGSVGGGAAPG
jgi:hypothetical protein